MADAPPLGNAPPAQDSIRNRCSCKVPQLYSPVRDATQNEGLACERSLLPPRMSPSFAFLSPLTPVQMSEGNADLSEPKSRSTLDLSEAIVNGELAIVAGSDTTSTTLSGVFFNLLTHPEYYERLRREVDDVFPPGEDPLSDANAGARMAEMKYLNAVM